VTVGGARKWVAGPAAFADCGYQRGNIDYVPTGFLSAWAEVEPVSRCTADGSVLLHADGKAHLVRSGWKRHIPNGATFEGMGLSWAGAAPVADSWLPNGHQLLDLVATGRLIHPPGDQRPIYVMEGGAKRHVVSGEVFSLCGYGWDAVSLLSDETVSAMPLGPAVTAAPCPKPTFPNGVLMAGTDGRVWVLRNNQRHWVRTVEAFTSCGYRWPDLNIVGDSIIAGLSQGPDVNVGACQ
jgi:hypothetical protein